MRGLGNVCSQTCLIQACLDAFFCPFFGRQMSNIYQTDRVELLIVFLMFVHCICLITEAVRKEKGSFGNVIMGCGHIAA